MCVNRKTFEWWSLLGFSGKQNSLCWICLDLRWFQTNVSFHIHSLDLSSRFWIKWMDLDIGGLGTTYQDECVKRSKTPWTPVGFASVPSPHCGTHLPRVPAFLRCTVQVVPLSPQTVSHTVSGLPSVLMLYIIHAKIWSQLCQLQREASRHVSGRICSETSLSLILQLETLSLIVAVARSRTQLFNFQPYKDFCFFFFFNLKKMKAENIWHNLWFIFVSWSF